MGLQKMHSKLSHLVLELSGINCMVFYIQIMQQVKPYLLQLYQGHDIL